MIRTSSRNWNFSKIYVLCFWWQANFSVRNQCIELDLVSDTRRQVHWNKFNAGCDAQVAAHCRAKCLLTMKRRSAFEKKATFSPQHPSHILTNSPTSARVSQRDQDLSFLTFIRMIIIINFNNCFPNLVRCLCFLVAVYGVVAFRDF